MAQGSVLVVEDDGIVAKDISSSLTALGFDVSDIAASGQEAIDKARSKRPDLVLMDIKLRGGMDGISAAGEISRTLNIPVVYLTAYADPQTIERAMQTKPYGFIIKPFDSKELDAALRVAYFMRQLDIQAQASLDRGGSDNVEAYRQKVIADNMRAIEHKKNRLLKELVESELWKQ